MYNSVHVATLPDQFVIAARNTYAPKATWWDDAKVMYCNWFAPIKGKEHQQRLESFYSGQASVYDVFRYRLLHGRVPMVECMPIPKAGVWLDMGGGTAANLELVKDCLPQFKEVVVLDLCRPLLKVAEERVQHNGWKNVRLVHGDATDGSVQGLPEANSVDLITMSYS